MDGPLVPPEIPPTVAPKPSEPPVQRYGTALFSGAEENSLRAFRSLPSFRPQPNGDGRFMSTPYWLPRVARGLVAPLTSAFWVSIVIGRPKFGPTITAANSPTGSAHGAALVLIVTPGLITMPMKVDGPAYGR